MYLPIYLITLLKVSFTLKLILSRQISSILLDAKMSKDYQRIISGVIIGIALCITILGVVLYVCRSRMVCWPQRCRNGDEERDLYGPEQSYALSISATNAHAPDLPTAANQTRSIGGRPEHVPRRSRGKNDLKPLRLADIMRKDIDQGVRSARVTRRER